MWIYRRKALLAHCLMIMIFYRYNLFRKNSIANPDQGEWVPNSLCEIPVSPIQSRVCLISGMGCTLREDFCFAMLYLDYVHGCVTYCSWVLVQLDYPGYYSSLMVISALMNTEKRVVVVRHFFTVEFLTPFFCVWNIWETLSSRWRIPLSCGTLRSFL